MKTSKRLTLKAPFDLSQWWTGLNQREIANQRVIVLLALGLIVALALYLRLTGINWDSDTHLNPDERHLTNVGTTIKFPSNPIDYFDTAESPLNSYNSINSYVYGTLPLFATKATAELMDKAPIGSPSGGGLWADYNHLNLVGRTLSALVDVAGVIVIFLLGSYLFSRRVGLLAALLLSLTVLHIQYAHYFVVDGWLVFFNLATLYFAARAAKQGGRWNFALSGAMFGLAMACKVSAITLVAVITLAAVIRAWPALKERWTQSKGAIVPARIWSGELKEPLIGLALAAVVSLAVFRVAQPYAFVGPYPWSLDINAFLNDPTDPLKLFINPVWRQDVTTVLDIQSGDGFFPPGWTWTGRAPWLYGLENLFLWGMGIPLFMASAAGVLYACWRVVKHRDFVLLLFIATIAITFLWQAGRFTSYMRYILPIYAPMVLLGAYVLVELWMWTGFSQLPEKLAPLVRRLNGYLPALTRTAVAGIVILTLLYGLAFTSIYRNPLTRVEASRWVYDNVPTGTVIANFHWDDGIPYNVDGRDAPSNYKFVDLKLYDLDTPEKTAGIIDSLDQTQYVMVSSDRLYRSITRAPAVYPIGTRFFDLLFAEQLGFELEKSFTSFPNLFGITISDDGAEESFTVYDHPKVLIYRKSADFSRQKVEQLLGAPSLDPVLVPPSEAGKNALLLRPDDLETQRNGGTWTDIFDPDSFVNENPGFAWIIWLLPVEALSLALVPVGLYLFRWLPDRGYLLLKPLGVLLLVYLVWLAVSLGLLEFTRGAVLGVMLLIMVLGIASGVVWRQQVLDYARQHWRAILTAEAVFLAAFFLFYGLRLLNPDLWHPFRGGEKPMDFAYLNAITRSTTLPPYDPWFAGGYINYYYFGQFITATLFKLTGIRPEVGYNLAVPLFFALTASATYSVGYNLTAAARSRIRRRPGGGYIPASSLRWAALLAVTLVLVVGNLHAFDQVVDGLSAKSSVHLGNGIPLVSGAVGAVGGLWQVIFRGAPFPAIDYWAASRMMPPSISITEFPFFSFLFADLHAHLMSIPFSVASLGLGLALVLTGTGDRRPGRWISSARTLSLAALLALVVGALRVTNSWDYPPFLLMGIVTVFIGELASEGRLTWPMALRFALTSAFLIALSIIAFYPFDKDYQQFQAGVSGTLETTLLRQYLAHFGLFIVIAVSLVAFLWARMLRRTGIALAARQFVVAVVGLVLLTTAFLLMVERLDSVFPISITNLTAGDFLENLVRVRVPRTPEQSLPSFPIPLLPFAYLALAAVAVLIWHEFKRYRPDTPLRLFVLVMLALALVLSIGVDIVTIDNDIQRMNTVFKFYIHIWLLFAITSAFSVWYLLATTRVRMPAITRVPRLRVHRLAMTRQLWVTVVGILFVATLAYPLAATPQRLNDRFLDRSPTSNGMAFMSEAVYQDEKGAVELRHDLDAIQWLRTNVEGSPAIIEAHTPYYRWGARFSIYTGLPTVIGWDWHQVTQRRKYSSLVETRMNDVKQFYSDPDPAAARRILQKYQVSYVIVGQLERLYYDPAGLTKFDDGLDGNLELVYENPGTRIYSVKTTSIPAAVEAPGPG